jgi:hypothetical protein
MRSFDLLLTTEGTIIMARASARVILTVFKGQETKQ